MKQTTLTADLTTGSVLGKLLTFSWPLMLSSLLQVVYNLVDMVVVGRFVGADGLSAVSNGSEILHLVTLLCMGFSSAGQIIISQQVGQKNTAGVQKTIGTMFSFLSLVSVVMTVAGLLLLDPIMAAINVPEPALDQARDYGVCCMYGLFFIFGYNEVSAILRGMGDSMRPFIFIMIAALANLALDLVFVAGLGWGVFGAAIATVIGQALSFVISLIYLFRKRVEFGFDFRYKSFRIDAGTLRALVKLGIPLALQSGAIMFSKLFVISYINAYGVAASAVNGIGNKISRCAMIVCQSIGTAVTSMVGQSIGAGKPDRVRRTVYASLAVCVAFSAALSTIMLLFPERIFAFFNNDPEVLSIARVYGIIAVVNFFGSALRSPMGSFVHGVGHSGLSLTIGLIDGLIGRVCLAMLFGLWLDMGVLGFWLGDACAGYIPFFIGGVYFWFGKWRARGAILS